MTPAALSIIMTTYSGAQRRTGLALWGAVGSLGVAAGVLLGGALTTWAGWQTIFWINAPIGAVAFLVGLKVIPQVTTPRVSLEPVRPARCRHRHRQPRRAHLRPRRHRAARLALRASARCPWPDLALLAVAFIALERRAASPLVPPHTWKVKSLVSGTTVMLGVTGILVGTVFLTSIFVQTVMGYSAIRAGVAFVPFALAITVGTVAGQARPGPRHPARHRRGRAAPRRRGRGPARPGLRRRRLRHRRPARVWLVIGLGRRHGLRPGVRDRHGRHPAAARRHGVRVPHDRARGRRRARCRRPVRGGQHRRHASTTAAGVVDGFPRGFLAAAGIAVALAAFAYLRMPAVRVEGARHAHAPLRQAPPRPRASRAAGEGVSL